MKTLTLSSLAILLLLALVAIPAAAAPWCANYCSCSSSCWTQCYDEGGASACDAYICDEFCLQPGTKGKAAANEDVGDLFAPELFAAPVNGLVEQGCSAPAEDLEVIPTQ